MSRRLLVNIHLFLSTFFADAVVLMAISGGLYLFGIDGRAEATEVAQVQSTE